MNSKAYQERVERLGRANTLIIVIASCGRRFFRHEDRVAELRIDARGRVFLIDEYTQVVVDTHQRGQWSGFNHGGTMRGLIMWLRDFICEGKQLDARVFGPWPETVNGGDLWAYGVKAMDLVRREARELGIVAAVAAAAESAGAA